MPLSSRLTTGSRFRARAILAAILLLGLSLRVGWMVTQVSVISSDGGEYATMAEHLRHQHALVGIYEGPAILYAPLYPILIAAVMLVVPNSETAAHLVSLLAGTALVAIVFVLAQRIYGRRTAYICATLAAVHPLLIALSASIYSEALYATLWLAMVLSGLRALELQQWRDALVLGLCVGLAYLTRVEAIAYVPIFAAALLTVGMRRKQARAAGVHAVIMCAGFLALASPYVSFFHRHTDRWRFEAKSDINYTMARNRIAGMSLLEADWGVGRDLTIVGPLLGPFQFADFTPYSGALVDRLKSLVSMAKLNAHTVYHNLVERQFGSPILWGLVIVGWFRTSWSRKRSIDEAVLFGLAGSIVMVTLTSATAEIRYLFTVVPVLLVWSGNGLQELAEWIKGWESMTDLRVVRPARIAAALQLGTAALMVGVSIGGVQDDGYFAGEHGAEASAARDAGMWLAQHGSESKRIAVRLAVVPYYAKGTLIAIPYGDPDTTLRYLATKNVDFIVLESAEARVLPTIGEWMAHGIPDPRARLVYNRTSSPGVRVVIYQWRQT